MKVLHIITDTNIGGAGRYLLNLLSQPAFKDVDVLVACPEGELGKRLDAMGIRRIAISGRDVSYNRRLTRELGSLMKAERPDLVHTHSSLSGRIAARLRRTPVVYTKHNLVRIPDEKGVVPPAAGMGKRLVNRLVAGVLSDRIIAVSGGVQKELIESGIKPAMVAAIPNGIDLSPYVPRWKQAPAEDGSAAKRGFLIGTVARLHRQKALDRSLAEVSANPKDAFALFNLGSNLVYFERYPEAASAYDQARQVGLPQRMLRYQFGPFFAYFHTGRMQDLLAVTEYALKITRNSEEAHLWHGWALFRQGNRQGAMDDFNAALEARPDYPDAEYALDFVRTSK